MRYAPLALLILTSTLLAQESPKSLGYTFPDEWQEHAGTMMIFPAKHQYGNATNGYRAEFVNLAKAIAENEPVFIFCYTPDERACRRLFENHPNIEIRVGDFSIDWARDNGPMLIRNRDGQLASAGFRFNGWGEKYRGWENDVDTRDSISREMGWPIFHSDLVLEGGSIEIGGGIGIVTESSVLNPNRTDWSKNRVESELKEMLGLDKIVWLKSGLVPDPITDGHVDGLVKFVAENTVLLHTTDDKSDPNYPITKEAKTVLQTHGLKIIELPLADDIVHINFYIGSGGKVAYVPICGDPTQDDPALEIIGRFYEKVVPILANKISEEGGGIHCITMQIPK